MTKICLNMIVKNEAAIIERCLCSVLPMINCWSITDTGSTDDTPKLITEFFAEHDIPGELHHAPFEDFSQARNAALRNARESDLEWDFLLLTDADMELVIEARQDLSLDIECYLLKQKAGSISYYNARLLNRSSSANYIGVTHEYLGTEDYPVKCDELWFQDHACGANRVEKYDRDKRLLEADLKRDPNNERTIYYLAQTLLEGGEHEKALLLLERRIEIGGWDEEVWHSYIRAADCALALGDENGFIATCLAAYDYKPDRAEALLKLATHYRETGKNVACLAICAIGREIPYPEDNFLFIEDYVYEWGFDYEISIAGFYVDKWREIASELCFALGINRDVEPMIRMQSRQNARFYAHKAPELFSSYKCLPLTPPKRENYSPMNPALWWGDNPECIVRTVNYRLEDNEIYITPGDESVTTVNWLADIDSETLALSNWREIVDLDGMGVEGGVVGPEDCRLFYWQGRRWCSATRMELSDDPVSTWGVAIHLLEIADDGAVLSTQRLNPPEKRLAEKNWMPYVDGDRLFFVYTCDPLVVLEVLPNLTVVEHVRLEPHLALDHLRGGTNVVRIGSDLVCLTHEVTYEGGNRVYLHRFLFLHGETLRIEAVSDPFKFGDTFVEFAAGLAVSPARNSLLITFGCQDREAFMCEISLRELEQLYIGSADNPPRFIHN
jgi:glycosyltransferase involved in cell wall biosynthesis